MRESLPLPRRWNHGGGLTVATKLAGSVAARSRSSIVRNWSKVMGADKAIARYGREQPRRPRPDARTLERADESHAGTPWTLSFWSMCPELCPDAARQSLERGGERFPET